MLNCRSGRSREDETRENAETSAGCRNARRVVQVYTGVPPATVRDLVARIQLAWQQLPLRLIRRAINALPERMRLCEENGGIQVVTFD